MAPLDPGLLGLADDSHPLGALPLSTPLPEECRVVGRDYALLEPLGEGGMGRVWRARQLSTGREVAVKLLREGRSEARFAREIAALAKLAHPGIVHLLQAGTHEGQAFLVLELVPGMDLARELANRALPPRDAAAALLAATEAIAAAHAAGLIHRDIKPSNLLRDASGKVRVTDFGLAKDLRESPNLTVSGEHLGTPAYMAPEQIDSRRGTIGPTTDVYGLGATLYHLLTGQPPFQGATTAEVLHQVAQHEPRWDGPWTALHRDLRTICQRAMNPDPTRRYPGADELATDLRRFLDGEAILARPIGWWPRLARITRKPWPRALLAASVLVTILLPVLDSLRHRTTVHALLADWPRSTPDVLHVMNLTGSNATAGQVSFSDTSDLMAVSRASPQLRLASLNPWSPFPHPIDHSVPTGLHRFQPGTGNLLSSDLSGRWRLLMVSPVFRVGIDERAQSNLTAIAFSRQGQQWAVASAAGDIAAWEFFANLQFRRTFTANHTSRVVTLTFDRPAKRLLSASSDGEVRLWDIRSDNLLMRWTPGGPCVGAEFLDEDSRIVAASVHSRRASTLVQLDPTHGTVLITRRIDGQATLLRVSPDGTRLALASERRWIDLLDSETLEPIARTSEHPEPPTSIEFSPDGLRLLAVDSGGNARIWDAHTGEPLSGFWRGSSGILHAAFARDGVQLGTADTGPSATLWNVACPIPRGWDTPSLLRALINDGRLIALRRAAWLAPTNPAVLLELARATATALPGEPGRKESGFLRTRASPSSAPRSAPGPN